LPGWLLENTPRDPVATAAKPAEKSGINAVICRAFLWIRETELSLLRSPELHGRACLGKHLTATGDRKALQQT